jgi:hypothetical protein
MSRKWATILTSLLIFGIRLTAQEKDSIYLYNGQVFIGDVKGGQMGEITIDDVDMKLLQIKQYKMKRFSTAKRCKIETQEKEVYFGVIDPSTKPGWIILRLDQGDTVEMPITAISLLIALRKNFFAQLEGNFSAGFSYAKSSDLGQLNFSTRIWYATEKWQYQLAAQMIGSIDSSKYSRDREDASVFVSRTITNSWFAATSVSYQRNLELSIARRYQELVGGGNKLFVRRDWQLLAISGLSFNQERRTDGTSSGLLLEIPVTLRFNFFKYRQPNMQISTSQTAFFSLSQQGRIRFDSNLNFAWELYKSFWITFNPYASFDNQALDNSSNFDYGSAISLSYKF